MPISTNATASATMLPPNRIPIPQNAFRPITNEMPSTSNSIPSTIGQAQGTLPKSTTTTVVNATTSSIVRPTIEPKVAKSIGRTNSIRNKIKPTTGIQLPTLAGTTSTNNIFNSNLPMAPKFPPFGQLSQAQTNVQKSMIYSPFINSVISNDQQYNDPFLQLFTKFRQNLQVNNLLKFKEISRLNQILELKFVLISKIKWTDLIRLGLLPLVTYRS
jgi:hypothetical protein